MSVEESDDPYLWLTPTVSYIDGVSALYDLGVLPCPGGLFDQPARLLQAIRLHKKAVYSVREILEARRKPRGTTPDVPK